MIGLLRTTFPCLTCTDQRTFWNVSSAGGGFLRLLALCVCARACVCCATRDQSTLRPLQPRAHTHARVPDLGLRCPSCVARALARGDDAAGAWLRPRDGVSRSVASRRRARLRPQHRCEAERRHERVDEEEDDRSRLVRRRVHVERYRYSIAQGEGRGQRESERGSRGGSRTRRVPATTQATARSEPTNPNRGLCFCEHIAKRRRRRRSRTKKRRGRGRGRARKGRGRRVGRRKGEEGR